MCLPDATLDRPETVDEMGGVKSPGSALGGAKKGHDVELTGAFRATKTACELSAAGIEPATL